MNIELLTSALDEYLLAQRDLGTGHIDLRDFQRTKKAFMQSLEKYIEVKIADLQYSNARKRDTIEFIGVIESVAQVLKSSYDTLLVLHSAPLPPENIDEWLDKANKREWINQYKKWHQKTSNHCSNATSNSIPDSEEQI